MNLLLTYCLVAGFTLAYTIFIWFQTDFIVQYAKLLKLGRFVKEKEWERYELTNTEPKYPYFLRETYENWITHMLGCPFCIAGFFSVFMGIFISWWAAGLIAFVAVFGFLLLMTMYKYIYSDKK